MTEGRLAYAEELTRVSRQIVGVMLVSWQRILRVGLFSGIGALLVAEIVACIVTASFPPPPMAHLIAGALAFAAGYNVAITALFVMLLRGGVRFVRHLEGDVAVGASAASVFARREAGDLGAGARRIFSGRRQRQRQRQRQGQQAPRMARPGRQRPAAQPRPAVALQGMGGAAAAVAAVGLDVARVARPRGLPADVRRDPDDAVIRAPAPAFQPLPVLASRLPRIEWSHDDQQPAPSASAALAPSAPTPALIVAVQEDNSVSPAMPTTTVPSGTPTVESDAATPDAATRAGASVASGDPPPARDDARQEPKVAEATVGTPDAPGLIPRGWRHTDATTRPLPAITRPLPTPSGARSGARSGGLWGRVSQALVGQAATDAETIADTKPEQAPVADEVTPVADDVAPEDAWLNG